MHIPEIVFPALGAALFAALLTNLMMSPVIRLAISRLR